MLFAATGSFGILFHLGDFRSSNPLQFDVFGIAAVRLLGVIAGIYMPRGANWARWLAVAWMALHVGISALHTIQELVVHSVFLCLLLFFLFRPAANAYFRPAAPREIDR